MEFFITQFIEGNIGQAFSILDHILKLIIKKEKIDMIKLPNEEEVKHVVFELSGNSAPRPDGFSGYLFQKY